MLTLLLLVLLFLVLILALLLASGLIVIWPFTLAVILFGAGDIALIRKVIKRD